jgi:hypothetical protein
MKKLSAADVATKLRCPLLCKVKMSLGSFRGSLGRRCGDAAIAAAAALAAGRPRDFVP